MFAKKNILTFLLMLLVSIGQSQSLTHIGLPFMKYFAYDEYDANPQNWDAVQAPNGKMYFANGDGVLEFDGNWWRLIKLPNKTVVRSLDISNNGTIYIGGFEEFGLLEENSIGQLEYRSLLHLLPEKHSYFQDVWTTFAIDDRVFFQTSTAVFELKDSLIKEYKPKWEFVWASVAYNHFFTQDAYNGLKVFKNEELKTLQGGDRFYEERIFNVLEYKDSLYIVATAQGNFFICDIDINRLKIRVLDSINNATTEIIKKNAFYTGVNYNNEKLIFSTYYGGLFLCDMSFNPILNLSESFGMENNNITNIYKDQNHNLWITMDKGITFVNMDLSMTILNKYSNVTGSINDAIIFDDPRDDIPERLYTVSIEGIYYKNLDEKPNPLNPKTFQKFVNYAGIRQESWELYNHNNYLFCASSYGTFQLLNNTFSHISWHSARSYTPIKNKPNLLLVNLENGLELLKYDGKKWRSKGKVAGSKGFINYSSFDQDGFLWTESVNEGVYKIKLSKNFDSIISKVSYSTDKGLPSPILNFPFVINDELKVTTEKGIYHFEKNNDRFIPDKKLNKLLGNIAPDNLIQTPTKNIWYKSPKSFGELVYQPDGTYIKDTSRFNNIRTLAIQNIYYHNDSNIFFCSSNGLIIYNKTRHAKKQESIKTHISKVEIIDKHDGSKLAQNRATENQPLILPFRQNAIRFSFAATSFVSPYKNQFSYYLEGFDKKRQWSNWSKQPVKEYNYLKEGNYVLHVKSRDLQMNQGNTVTYHFEILAPWYRTNVAYTIYFILLAGLLYSLSILNSRRLKRANLRLENKVKIRTEELREQKKKVTDSIEYALQIQKAILPSEETIAEISKDFFIYYSPKDIVSGDFYWHAKSKDFHYYATVDCTGHGVPGGFMSMIGNTLLNELVVHDKVLEPAQVLKAMNSKLQYILNQSDKDTGANSDGMELSLIRIDKKNQVLTISSAMQSVILIENDVIKHIKGDPYEIGDEFLRAKEIEFTQQSFNYDKNCKIYTFTDGFTDQFGGVKKQKFTFGRLKNLLFDINNLPMDTQKEKLEKAFEAWKGDNRQIDDVTIIGIKL
jgi:hypothetical protein